MFFYTHTHTHTIVHYMTYLSVVALATNGEVVSGSFLLHLAQFIPIRALNVCEAVQLCPYFLLRGAAAATARITYQRPQRFEFLARK